MVKAMMRAALDLVKTPAPWYKRGMADSAPAPAAADTRTPFYKSRKFYICCATILSLLVMFAQHQINATVFEAGVVLALTTYSAGIAIEDHGSKSAGSPTSVATGSGDVTVNPLPAAPSSTPSTGSAS